MIEFLDSSALVKRYTVEPGSAAVQRVTRSANVAVARIAHVEVASALARLTREHAMKVEQRDEALERFDEDFGRWKVVELRARVAASARSLVCRHPVRGYDAVQLASALELRKDMAVRFWCTDAALGVAAASEGLAVVVPS